MYAIIKFGNSLIRDIFFAQKQNHFFYYYRQSITLYFSFKSAFSNKRQTTIEKYDKIHPQFFFRWQLYIKTLNTLK